MLARSTSPGLRRLAAAAGVMVALGVAIVAVAAPGGAPKRPDRLAMPSMGRLAEIPHKRPAAAGIIDAGSPPAELASAVVADAQDLWARAFAQVGRRYRFAEVVVLRGGARKACRSSHLGAGPYYCPVDETVYIEPRFLVALRERFGDQSTFAQAFVVAHEVAHHVQKLDGVRDEVDRAVRDYPQSADWLRGREELQADCLAGVWGNWTHRYAPLAPTERRTALAAAFAMGDDQLKSDEGWPAPELLTHGAGTERRRWLAAGLDSGDPRSCDPFR